MKLSSSELWIVRDYVRDLEHGRHVYDRQEMERVHDALLANKDETEITFSEGFLWEAEARVPQDLMIGGQPVGRYLMIKIMQEIRGFRGQVSDLEMEVEEMVKGLFEAPEREDQNAGDNNENTSEDTAGSTRSGEETEAGRDLRSTATGSDEADKGSVDG